MNFPWNAGHDALRIMISFGLVLPVGWYREKEGHTIGVRTFPLVAVASCGYVLLGTAPGMTADSQSRIIQGLVAGMGFIGGGAILKHKGNVTGAAVAASIWNTGVVGAAVAQDRFALAAILAALNLFVLSVMLPVKERLDHEGESAIAKPPASPGAPGHDD